LVFIGVDDPAAGADFFTTPVASQYAGVKVWATAALDIFENAWVKNGGGIFGFFNWCWPWCCFQPGIAFQRNTKRTGLYVGIGCCWQLFIGYFFSSI